MFIVMFSLGFGPIPWMMVGELFAAEVIVIYLFKVNIIEVGWLVGFKCYKLTIRSFLLSITTV
jgi:hypothetical protein